MDIRDSPSKFARRIDTIRLDEANSTYYTKEGYLIDRPILTSCGIFQYTNPDGTIRRELRLPENVFNQQSLESYKGKPIIVTHEAGTVDKNNVSQYEVGTILSDGYEDGNDVRAEIIIHDTDAMERAGLKELSLGYNLDLIEQPGTWRGQHYDAIQTNIRVNHLALVRSARAGEQARLNIDSSDEPVLKGGKVMFRKDEGLTPDELKAAIEAYKAKKAAGGEQSNGEGNAPAPTPKPDTGANQGAKPVAPMNSKDSDAAGQSPMPTPSNPTMNGGDPQSVIANVRSHATAREQGSDAPSPEDDIKALVACLESMLHKDDGNEEAEPVPPTPQEQNEDEDSDNAQAEGDKDTMNLDSVDEMVNKKLKICRLGDKLNLDGLDSMSIKDGMKAVIAKAMPTMRLDGKDDKYISACFDMAVEVINNAKDANYQRKQISTKSGKRADSNDGMSMAEAARLRMISREEGSNE